MSGSTKTMKDVPVRNTSVKVIGFLTVLLLWTLDGDSGRDMNDVVVDYVVSKTEVVAK